MSFLDKIEPYYPVILSFVWGMAVMVLVVDIGVMCK
jgi:hypothetical protein